MAFYRDALLLVGHGSSRYADAAGVLLAHAETLRAGGHFAEVAVGLLRGTPGVEEAVAGLKASVIRVVPFFMEDGYFTRVAVPAALRRHRLRDRQVLHISPAVGTHDRMANLIEGHVLRNCFINHDALSVVLVGHGSARAPGRSTALHRHQAHLTAMQRFGRVLVAFLEEPPLVSGLLAGLRTVPTAIVGFFAGEGGHVRDDLPGLVAAELACRGAGAAPLWSLGGIAGDPALPALILDHVTTTDSFSPSLGE